MKINVATRSQHTLAHLKGMSPVVFIHMTEYRYVDVIQAKIKTSSIKHPTTVGSFPDDDRDVERRKTLSTVIFFNYMLYG